MITINFSNYTQNLENHEVQLFLLSLLQQPTKTCHQLVRLGPDTLLGIPYTTLKSELLPPSHYKNYIITAKNTLHLQHLVLITWAFLGTPPHADIIALVLARDSETHDCFHAKTTRISAQPAN